jgi:hypothetical protein
MFLPPPKSDARWVYDDPSGVPEGSAPAPAVTTSKRDKILLFPVRVPARPKAA